MPLRLAHLGTRVTFAGDSSHGPAGQTLWAASGDDGEAGVAWDWVRIEHGIVAMADPMAVVTNLRLVADDGTVLTALQAARVLTGLVHGLPWQDEVVRALRATH
ncbi:MAG: hypothetical protein MUF03_09275 [Rubrivivax sp.]|jgi:hypothetical protein|nr:hypothetical protein [Rubrivivax sp.]